jgi:hypothetical protein
MPVQLTEELRSSLTQKSDEELLAMLDTPEDWRPEVVDFARDELTHRSVDIDKQLAALPQHDPEVQRKATEPLSRWQFFWAIVAGACPLLPGIILAWSEASRYKSEGFQSKSQQFWNICWTTFGAIYGTVFAVALFFALVARH